MIQIHWTQINCEIPGNEEILGLNNELPSKIQKKAKKSYKLFEDNPSHPGLRLKKVVSDPPTYSVRISQDYRALGVKEKAVIIWFWIGNHDEYERLISRLSQS